MIRVKREGRKKINSAIEIQVQKYNTMPIPYNVKVE